jgi:hypothetical protein
MDSDAAHDESAKFILSGSVRISLFFAKFLKNQSFLGLALRVSAWLIQRQRLSRFSAAS